MFYLTESSTTEDETDGGEDTPEGTDVAVKVESDRLCKKKHAGEV